MDHTRPYIYKILENVKPNQFLTEDAFNYINFLLTGIVLEISNLYQTREDNIRDAVVKFLTERILVGSIMGSDNRVESFITSMSEYNEDDINVRRDHLIPRKVMEQNQITRSYYSGLTMSTVVVEDFLKKIGYRICSDYFIIFITSILEHLLTVIFTRCISLGNVTDNIIDREDIVNTINIDMELSKMVSNISINEWSTNIDELIMNNTIRKDGLLKFGRKWIPIDNEFLYDSSRLVGNESIQLENDILNFESFYNKML